MRLIYILMCGITALLLTACTAVTDDYVDDTTQPNVAHRYINLAIAVSNNSAVTRGTPSGGEDGDGREAGFARENAITGITLVLYQTTDVNGINTTANPVIDFVAYYPVTRSTATTTMPIEARYETGNQLVPHNTIDFTKPYRAIVVANADLTASITAGTSHLNDLRNMTLDKIYSGDETKMATACGGFVMSSEQDQTLSFAGQDVQDAAGDYYYDMTGTPLVIERMAARIDFWAVNGTYNSDKGGYVYNVEGGLDQFVVTRIMPFNLANKHTTYGNEYLLKRLTADFSTPEWLINETTSNYVLDPQTTTKVTASTPLLTNALESVYGLTTAEAFAANSYCKAVGDLHNALAASTSVGYSALSDLGKTGEDVIVAYPMENTLLQQSLLYYHATGIALEGWYYHGGINADASPQRYVYYGYLRHQGEGTSYEITTSNDVNALPTTGVAMNFGIVRNNIYRVWIGSIDAKRNLHLRIVVKNWDVFTHKQIYM